MTGQDNPRCVAIGTHVEIEMIDQDGTCETLALDVVRPEFADLARGLLGANSPLAQAILGAPAGAQVPYEMADMRSVRVLSVSPSDASGLEEVLEKREAVLRKAVSAAQRTNAEMFAASFSGKWGDYNLDEPDE